MKNLFLLLGLLVITRTYSQNWTIGHSNSSTTKTPAVTLSSSSYYYSIFTENVSGVNRIRVVKFSFDLSTVIWDKSHFAGTATTVGQALFDSDGDLILVGSQNGNPFYCKIYNSTGLTAYSKVLNIGGGSIHKAVLMTKTNNDIAFVGTSTDTKHALYGRINKINGSINWARYVLTEDILRGTYSLCEIENGNIIIAGGTYVDNFSIYSDNVLLEVNPSGSQISLRRWNYNHVHGGTTCVNSNIDNIVNIPGTNKVAFLYHTVGLWSQFSYKESSRDYGVTLFDYSTGTIIWENRYPRNADDGERGTDILYNSKYNQIVVAASVINPTSNRTRFIHQIDPSNGSTLRFINLNPTSLDDNSFQLNIKHDYNEDGVIFTSVKTTGGNSKIVVGYQSLKNLNSCNNQDATGIGTSDKPTIEHSFSPNVVWESNVTLTPANNSNQIESICGSTCPLVGTGITVLNAQNITTDQVYSGKYIVTGRVVFLGDITIDITNCDFIFTGCGAGLYFIQGAHLRANNSVFRPCNETYYWEGITFYNTGNNKVHACVIKNAVEGLKLIGDGSETVITDNLFQNNFRGILFQDSRNTGSVAGNTFDVSNANADNPIICLGGNLTDRSFNGIRAINSMIKSGISDNNFVSQFSSSAHDRMMGIVLENSTAYITKNHFTNQDIAIRVVDKSYSTPIEISSNEFEFNSRMTQSNPQIYILNSNNNIMIANNTLNDRNGNYSFDAIDITNTRASIKENKFSGFRTAIKISNSTNCLVTSNEITNANTYGIYNNLCNTMLISCNTIKMYKNPMSNPVVVVNPVGICLYENDLVPTSYSYIQNNCVFDSYIALYIYKSPGNQGTPLATIRNNFFYNYFFRGINLENCSGNIGTAAAYGRNTLYSNTLGVYDVYSNIPGTINLYYNYMLAPTSWNVTINNNLQAHSTANCANQINLSQKVANSDIISCDVEFPNVGIPPLELVSGDHSGLIGQDVALSNFMHVIDLSTANYAQVSASESYKKLSEEDKLYIDYYYSFLTSDYNKALSILTQLSSMNSSNHKYRILAEKMKSLMGDFSEDASGMFYNDSSLNYFAVSNLNLNPVNSYDYYSSPYPELVISAAGQQVQPEINSFVLYPNPAKNETNISVDNYYGKTVKISIMDITGQVVYECSRTENNINMNISLSEFKPGVYIVSVQVEDEAKSQKLVVF